MRFTIVALGRGAPRPIQSLVEDYRQRLQRLAPLSLIEVAEERRTSARQADQETLLRKEAGRLQRKIPLGATVIPLDLAGTPLSSPALAEKIDHFQIKGVAELCFLIGGPDGLHPSLLEGRWRLSFGPLTLPHLLVRVVLTEQLYRAMTILNRIPYHR